jgi:hypothetical protein
MIDIYSKNTEFEPNEILDQMAKIDEEIEAERGKDDNEYDREKEFKLLYKQFVTGLKLNTGNIRIF